MLDGRYWRAGGLILGFAASAVAIGVACRRPSAAGARSVEEPATESLEGSCRQVAAWWQRQLPKECLPPRVHPPWVISGEVSSEVAEKILRQVLLPVAAAVARQYDLPPTGRPRTVLLFSSEEAFRRQSLRLFGPPLPSESGFYRSHLRTLVVRSDRIDALRHELTHALFDLPGITLPPWLSEGVATLTEVGDEGPQDVRTEGWRFAVAREAVRGGEFLGLDEILAAEAFGGSHRGLQYAESFSLCRYLRDQELLAPFWRQFHRRAADDPQGRKSLAAILGPEGLSRLEEDLKRYLMGP